jgi:hypothetical protein
LTTLGQAGFVHHWVGDPAGLISAWAPAMQLPTCLMVTPFAEEQGRCRRLQYEMSAALAAHGLNGCWLDLPGTGDSPVDETAITAAMWLDSISAALDHVSAPVMIGGLRLGGAVALHWGQNHAPKMPVVAIEPISGRYALRTLLRSRTAQAGLSTEQLLHCLAEGETIEVAGYPLNQATKTALDQFSMAHSDGANIGIIRSALADMPPWLQMEPLPADALAQHLAEQIIAFHQSITT